MADKSAIAHAEAVKASCWLHWLRQLLRPIQSFFSEKNNHCRIGLDGTCKGRAVVLNQAREEIEVEINAAPLWTLSMDLQQGREPLAID